MFSQRDTQTVQEGEDVPVRKYHRRRTVQGTPWSNTGRDDRGNHPPTVGDLRVAENDERVEPAGPTPVDLGGSQFRTVSQLDQGPCVSE